MTNRPQERSALREWELALKAASDPTRTRILKLLEDRGLCVCQIQAVLGLAPSTVSKHLSLLKLAGLVEDRRSGKWIEYALTGAAANAHAGPVLALLRGALARDPRVMADRKRLREVLAVPLEQLCSLPPVRVRSLPGAPARAARAAGRPHA